MARRRVRTTAIMLAGTLRPSPLREALGMPELCLPLGHGHCLLDAWQRALGTAGRLRELSIVVNDEPDVTAVEDALLGTGLHRPSVHRGAGHPVHIVAEPASWRGTAGILRDVANDLDGDLDGGLDGGLDDDDLVFSIEATCLPPRTLQPLIEAMDASRDLVGVVAVVGDDEPAGVCVYRPRALRRVPAVGYFDVKEQLLPALHREGEAVAVVHLGEEVRRLRDRASCLEAVRRHLQTHTNGNLSIDAGAGVSTSAVLDGRCVVEDAVIVEDGAVVHDSLLMRGARIGGGAVISASIVGPNGRVAARARVVRAIIPAEAPDAGTTHRRVALAGRREAA